MKISEHIISSENGIEYFDIFFKVSNKTDLNSEQYEEIEYLIYKKLQEYDTKRKV